MFSKNDKIIANGELNAHLIKKITKEMNVKVKNRSGKTKGYKFLDTWTVDDEACALLDEFLTNRKKIKSPLSIFSTCSDKELKLMSQVLRKKFVPRKKDPQIRKILDSLEERHAETKFSTAKSSQLLQNIRNK